MSRICTRAAMCRDCWPPEPSNAPECHSYLLRTGRLRLSSAATGPSEPVGLVVAGNDRGALGDAQSLVKRLGLGFRVVFTGLLACRERLEALADADVVAYVSEHEVFGLVPLEALLAGTPVVVGDDSG